MIGVVVTSFDRPRYLRRMLRSLADTTLTSPTTVVFVDDGSQRRRTIHLLMDFKMPNARVFKILRPRVSDFGVHECLRIGWDFLLQECDCRYLANLDSDALVTNDWLTRLERLYAEQRAQRGPLLVTGFNTRNHPVLSWQENYCLKATCGGINLFFDEPFYREIVRPALHASGWDWAVMRALHAAGYPLVCCRPSVVQHIGARGFNSSPKQHDFADDFPQSSLSRWSLRLWPWFTGPRAPARQDYEPGFNPRTIVAGGS